MNEDILVGIVCGVFLAGVLSYVSFNVGVRYGKVLVTNLIHAMQLQAMAKQTGTGIKEGDADDSI